METREHVPSLLNAGENNMYVSQLVLARMYLHLTSKRWMSGRDRVNHYIFKGYDHLHAILRIADLRIERSSSPLPNNVNYSYQISVGRINAISSEGGKRSKTQ